MCFGENLKLIFPASESDLRYNNMFVPTINNAPIISQSSLTTLVYPITIKHTNVNIGAK